MKKVVSGLAALALGIGAAFAVPAIAHATEDLEGWYTWETTYSGSEDPTGGTITWPQTLLGKGHAADLTLKCGVWYQSDLYEGKNKDIEKVIKDGILSHDGQPEDHKIVKDWYFTYGGDCPVEEPPVEEPPVEEPPVVEPPVVEPPVVEPPVVEPPVVEPPTEETIPEAPSATPVVAKATFTG